MSSTYGKSAGGFLWVLIEPIAGIALMTWIFSLAFRSPPIGDSFPLFYATGVVPFLFFLDVSSKTAQTIRFSRQLLSYPIISHVDALLARFLLNSATQLLVALTLFVVVCLAFSNRAPLNFEAIALSFIMIMSTAFAVGSMNCFLFNMFPVWERVWSILMRPMFLVSAIFFLFEDVPEPYASFLWYNPIVHFVGAMRRGFFSTYEADYVSPMYIFSLAAVLTVIALIFLNRYFIELRN